MSQDHTCSVTGHPKVWGHGHHILIHGHTRSHISLPHTAQTHFHNVSVSRIATMLCKTSCGCQGREASLSLSLSLSHTHIHMQSYMEAGFISSPRCAHFQPLQPPPTIQAGVQGT